MKLVHLQKRSVTALFKGVNVDLHINTIKVNDDIRGVSGFIQHKLTKKIAYINTEISFINGYLYRAATSLSDYSGGMNNHAKDSHSLYVGVLKLIS